MEAYAGIPERGGWAKSLRTCKEDTRGRERDLANGGRHRVGCAGVVGRCFVQGQEPRWAGLRRLLCVGRVRRSVAEVAESESVEMVGKKGSHYLWGRCQPWVRCNGSSKQEPRPPATPTRGRKRWTEGQGRRRAWRAVRAPGRHKGQRGVSKAQFCCVCRCVIVSPEKEPRKGTRDAWKEDIGKGVCEQGGKTGQKQPQCACSICATLLACAMQAGVGREGGGRVPRGL